MPQPSMHRVRQEYLLPHEELRTAEAQSPSDVLWEGTRSPQRARPLPTCPLTPSTSPEFGEIGESLAAASGWVTTEATSSASSYPARARRRACAAPPRRAQRARARKRVGRSSQRPVQESALRSGLRARERRCVS